MKDVAAAWRPALQTSHPGLQLNLSCVFTHQTPYVNWANSHAGFPRHRCELADLLIVFLDKKAAQPGGIATLIQAKQSDTGSVSLTNKSEKLQFDLLSSRPIFNVEGKAAPSGRAPWGEAWQIPMPRRSTSWPVLDQTVSDLNFRS